MRLWETAFQHTETIKDYSLATFLTTTPIWVPLLDNVNVILTTITLVIGLVIGIIRLRKDISGKTKDDN